MNKYLLMSAAALVATSAATTGVEAKSKSPTSIALHSSGGGTYCDGIELYWSGKDYVGHHLFTNCGYSATDIGVAEGSKKPASVTIGDSYYFTLEDEEIQFGWVISLPLKSGGTWAILASETPFTTTSVLNSGDYEVGYAPAKRGAPSSLLNAKTIARMPTAARIKSEQILATRK